MGSERKVDEKGTVKCMGSEAKCMQSEREVDGKWMGSGKLVDGM